MREEREYSGGSKMSRERRVREGDTKQIDRKRGTEKLFFSYFFRENPLTQLCL